MYIYIWTKNTHNLFKSRNISLLISSKVDRQKNKLNIVQSSQQRH